MKKLTAWGVAVAIAYIIFARVISDGADPFIVGTIGATMLVSGFIMLFFTREWTPRALGMMSVALGTATLYLGSLLFYVAPETKQYFEPVTDLARAFLVVGGPLWAYGIVRYMQSVVTSIGDEMGGD